MLWEEVKIISADRFVGEPGTRHEGKQCVEDVRRHGMVNERSQDTGVLHAENVGFLSQRKSGCVHRDIPDFLDLQLWEQETHAGENTRWVSRSERKELNMGAKARSENGSTGRLESGVQADG